MTFRTFKVLDTQVDRPDMVVELEFAAEGLLTLGAKGSRQLFVSLNGEEAFILSKKASKKAYKKCTWDQGY